MQSTKQLAAALAEDFAARIKGAVAAEHDTVLDLLEMVVTELCPPLEANAAALAKIEERAAAAEERLVVLEAREASLAARCASIERDMKAANVTGRHGPGPAPFVLPASAQADPEIEQRLRALEERASVFAPVALR